MPSRHSTTDYELLTPSAPLRPHVDELCLPFPCYFSSLNDLHDWYSMRHSTLTDLTSTLPCHPPTTLATREMEDNRPQLLVCHDFQGGYTEKPTSRGYTMEYWDLVHVFVYFSHKRVTIPPVGWIDSARHHGTKILGTVIFEWSESASELAQLLRGPENERLESTTFSPVYADELIELALQRGFDGYLINIEVALDLGLAVSGQAWPAWAGESSRLEEKTKNAQRLHGWVDYLRRKGNERLGKEWQVLWYDSVTQSGDLAWQDAVTTCNAPFFQSAQSIFTNYTWARPPPVLPPGTLLENMEDFQRLQMQGYGLTGPNDGGLHPALELSCAMADSLSLARNKVYVGIDVFGRNCFGGMNTHRSLAMIRPLNLSIALFAPGWTWEHLSSQTFAEWHPLDTAFWKRVADFFPARCIGKSSFYTNFSTGSGEGWYLKGEKVSEGEWTDVGVTMPKLRGYPIEFGDAWSGACSVRVQETVKWDLKLEIEEEAEYLFGVVAKGSEKVVPSLTGFASRDYMSEPLQNGWTQHRISATLPAGRVSLPIAFASSAQSYLLGEIFIHPRNLPAAEDGECTYDASTGLLTWPEAPVPSLSYYQVFHVPKGGDREEWLGTATREEKRNEFVVTATPEEGSKLVVRSITGNEPVYNTTVIME